MLELTLGRELNMRDSDYVRIRRGEPGADQHYRHQHVSLVLAAPSSPDWLRFTPHFFGELGMEHSDARGPLPPYSLPQCRMAYLGADVEAVLQYPLRSSLRW